MPGIKRTPADAAFSDCVRERAGWACQFCGKTEGLECCHIKGRRSAVTRWAGINAVCLCHYHHRYFTENPVEFTRWLEEEIGAGALEIITEKSRGILKNNAATRKEVAAHYREQLKIMQEKRNAGHQGWLDFVSYN